jgi:hypothetical protein
MSFPWPYRRIATEEAVSVPEVSEALRGWVATADPAEPDQDFWDFVFTQDNPGLGCSRPGWPTCCPPGGRPRRTAGSRRTGYAVGWC